MRPHTRPERNEKCDFFNTHAPQWDIEQQQKLPLIRSILRELDVQEGDAILEPGCGTGTISQLLREKTGGYCRLYSFDMSPAMLQQARCKFPKNHYYYLRADAHAMPFPTGAFHTVLCFAVFPHFTDRPAALRECRRVLKHGGRLMIAHALSRSALNTLHTEAGDAVAQDRLPDDDTMRSLLEKSGFSVLSLEDRADRYILQARSE